MLTGATSEEKDLDGTLCSAHACVNMRMRLKVCLLLISHNFTNVERSTAMTFSAAHTFNRNMKRLW